MKSFTSIQPRKRSALGNILFIFCCFPLPALAQGSLIVPKPNADLSAHRIDSDIFGWNDDYSEMAAIGLDIKRGPKGKHRGEVFMLIFPLHSVTPTQNVKIHHVTQADMPHNPLPILDVREYLWTLGYGLPKMWKKRPLKKAPHNAMQVTPLWLPQKQANGLCRPSVGFLLSTKQANRYQQHKTLNIEVPCAHLHLSDKRIYFAHKFLAGAMLRFDHSATDNEASVRFPLSADWQVALPFNLEIQKAPGTSRSAIKALKAL